MMNYFEKIEEKPKEDLSWNIPEQKSGTVNVVGGNGQSFRTEVKISEFLANKYPFEKINTVLPDALKNKLPNLENFLFLSSTESGSFSGEEELLSVFEGADFNFLVGDFSKNNITAKILMGACLKSERPLFLTRDTVDLIANEKIDRLLLKSNFYLFASIPQLQKILRAVYYPKILTLSMPLTQVVEVLHKFTLSYPTKIITLNNGQILIAENGKVIGVPLERSGYSMMMVWSGELAGKIMAFNLYNPNNFLDASVSGIFN